MLHSVHLSNFTPPEIGPPETYFLAPYPENFEKPNSKICIIECSYILQEPLQTIWSGQSSTIRQIQAYLYMLKKNFVRGVVRGIYFYICLLQRLSRERGQNWHMLPLYTCYNMHKSNKNTILTQPSGRIQSIFVMITSHFE